MLGLGCDALQSMQHAPHALRHPMRRHERGVAAPSTTSTTSTPASTTSTTCTAAATAAATSASLGSLDHRRRRQQRVRRPHDALQARQPLCGRRQLCRQLSQRLPHAQFVGRVLRRGRERTEQRMEEL